MGAHQVNLGHWESGKNTSRHLLSHPPATDLPMDTQDDDIAEENPCCVCRENTPPHPRTDALQLFSCIACDACDHRVQQRYCKGTQKIFCKEYNYPGPYGRLDFLDESAENLHKRKRVCGEHFPDSAFSNNPSKEI